MSKHDILSEASFGAAGALILILTPHAIDHPAAGIVCIIMMLYGLLWLQVNSEED